MCVCLLGIKKCYQNRHRCCNGLVMISFEPHGPQQHSTYQRNRTCHSNARPAGITCLLDLKELGLVLSGAIIERFSYLLIFKSNPC